MTISIINQYRLLNSAFSILILLLIGMPLYAQDEEVIIERYNHLPSGTVVTKIDVDKGNRKILSTNNGVFKITKFDDRPDKIYNDGVASTGTDRKGNLWTIGNNGDITNLTTGESHQFPDNEEIKITCSAIHRGQILIGTTRGVYIFNLTTSRWLETRNTDNSGFASNEIRFIHTDKYDVNWIGTAKGVLRVQDKMWDKKLYDKNMDFLVAQESEEGLWMITDKEFWFVFDENRWNQLSLKDDWYSGKINDFAFDNKGRLYIASNVLTRVDPYSEEIETFSDDLGLLSKKCLALSIDKNNQVWIGTGGSGLYRIRFSDNEADLLTASCILENEISCNGGRTASVRVNVSGGKAPYKYKWSERRARGKNPRNLKAGIYTVTVSDDNDFEFVSSIEILEPDALQLTFEETKRITSRRKKDGYARVAVFGGTAPYKVSWNNKEKGLEAKNLRAGMAEVTVTDSNGCEIIDGIEIKKERILPQLVLSSVEVGQTLRINELYFEADSSIVNIDSYDVLDEIFDFLQNHNEVVIEIGGHTNTIPPHEYCDRLSKERARNVADYLIDKGIDSKRIAHKGYGKRQPITADQSLAGRQRNQRVEVKILSVGE